MSRRSKMLRYSGQYRSSDKISVLNNKTVSEGALGN